MSYTITIDRMGFERESIRHYPERSEALEAWDLEIDCAQGGEVFTLRNPDGEIMSQYTPAVRAR